jgi:hypothetical protein
MKHSDRIFRVQELFTAEPAEGAENTRWLSVLGGEWLGAPVLSCDK